MQKEWDRNDADRHPKTPKHHFHDIPPNREIHFVFEIEYSVTVSNGLSVSLNIQYSSFSFISSSCLLMHYPEVFGCHLKQ